MGVVGEDADGAMMMEADPCAAKILDAADQPVVIGDNENEEELFRSGHELMLCLDTADTASQCVVVGVEELLKSWSELLLQLDSE